MGINVLLRMMAFLVKGKRKSFQQNSERKGVFLVQKCQEPGYEQTSNSCMVVQIKLEGNTALSIQNYGHADYVRALSCFCNRDGDLHGTISCSELLKPKDNPVGKLTLWLTDLSGINRTYHCSSLIYSIKLPLILLCTVYIYI